MNQSVRLLICLSAGVVLCQCSSPKKKKTDLADMKLEQRAMLKPDDKRRSQFEKYLTGSNGLKGSAGTHFQKQTHHSKSFSGGNSYAGQKQFKTSQSWFGKSKAPGMDQTYALGDKTPSGLNGFKTNQSRFGSMQSREGAAAFNGSRDIFKTDSALTRSQSIGKAPSIIENYNDLGNKKSAYTEAEVKKLLNRN
ncbi:MAG: hypothetical protein ACKVY0_08985 [Prosthecobacter sp.]|uniref:hypothetical protein n=1 Tax=Prosthecobacter sp. TaxID=1965333 RepID=UPI003903AA7D